MIIRWCALVLSVGAMGDAIAHGAYLATAILTLSTHAILRHLLGPKRA